MSDDVDKQPKASKRPRRRRRKPKAAEAAVAEPVASSSSEFTEQVEAWRAAAEKARVALKIPEALISNDALRIVEKLNEQGHLSYVVGGCVRDLALGTEPKDFDVVTTARPQQVRRAFRYARIIGRRFRLVHVRFGRDRMIEVATFRAQVPEAGEGEDLLVREDNVYGAPEEDARRRDFTVNAIAYDPVSKGLSDPFGGRADIQTKTIRAVGEPLARFREDGLRVLRAARFCATLEFDLEGETEAAIPGGLDVFERVSAE